MNLKNRTRLVSFRLTPDEFENLRVACLLHGARNVSDFARGAVLDLSNTSGRGDSHLLDRFSSVELRLTELHSLAQQHQDVLRALARALAARDDKSHTRAEGKGA